MVEEDNPSLNKMRRNYKKRLPFNNCRYVNYVEYADVMHSGKRAGVTIKDDDLALIVCFGDKKYLWSGAMHFFLNVYKKIDFFHRSRLSIKNSNLSRRYLNGKPWEKLLNKYHVDTGMTETELPC